MKILLIVLCIFIVVVVAVAIFDRYYEPEEYHLEVYEPISLTVYSEKSNVSQAGYGASYEVNGTNYYLTHENVELLMSNNNMNYTEISERFNSFYVEHGIESFTQQQHIYGFKFDYKISNETIGEDTNAKIITHMYDPNGDDLLNPDNFNNKTSGNSSCN